MTAISSPLTIEDPTIAKGSWILVTGINGYIGSHTGDQLLGAGYKVRGVVRNVEKSQWLFDKYEPYGKENFSLVEIADLTAEGAFDEAVKGEPLHTSFDLQSRGSKEPADFLYRC
jgi:nucleoside-diphosphate-sugar epimerase